MPSRAWGNDGTARQRFDSSIAQDIKPDWEKGY